MTDDTGDDTPHLDKYISADDLDLVPVEALNETWIVGDLELEPDDLQELYGGGTMSVTFSREANAIHISLSDEVESRSVVKDGGEDD
jgi:hypothetical protein